VTSRVWLRAAALALVALGIVVGLTVYFSTQNQPPCFVSGVRTWRPPTDGKTHRYVVVFPSRAACFFAVDDHNRLVGQLKLPAARRISYAAPLQQDVAVRTPSGPYTLDLRTGRFVRGGLVPFPSDTLTATDPQRRVMYVTQRGLLGYRVLDMRDGTTRYVVHFQGFTWNPRFGPNPPSHGLSLAPDRPELWVLDTPNRTVHVFDVSAVPAQPPSPVEDVRLSKTFTDVGSLLHSSDGRYVYVGDVGDVIDAQTRKLTANLDALQHTHVLLEVDWVHGRPVFPGPR
jgi:hypothetical protein